MYYTNDIRTGSMTAFLTIVFLLSAIIVVFGFYWYIPFKEKRKYIKMEISRTKGERQCYWKRELKKLYISQIPIIGNLITRHM